MPVHDWSRVNSGTFHDFHQDWTIEIRRTLNGGVLPKGYFAMADQRINGPEPDVVTLNLGGPTPTGGLAIADAPPKSLQMGRIETEKAIYARKANRLVVQHQLGRVVAVIEIVSPGNKDSVHALRSFTSKAVDFLRSGIHFFLVDLFPPSVRDPDGIHHAIWEELSDEPFPLHPIDKPLTVASYNSGSELVAYVNPIAVGDAIPDTPLFLDSGTYVYLPLEQTYNTSWSLTPEPIRNLVHPIPSTE